jgi:hypothetical protein
LLPVLGWGMVGRQPEAENEGDKALRRFVRTCALVGIVLSATASSVQAKPLDHIRFHEQGSWIVHNYCGDLRVRFDLDDSGVIVLRTTGPNGLPRFTATHHGGLEITNLATGKAFTFTWHYALPDVRVSDNGDGTLTLVYQVPGPETIYGPDGQRLHTNGGTMRFEVILDHAGTPGDPSDDVVISETVISSVGGQPQDPFDYCAAFRTLTS